MSASTAGLNDAPPDLARKESSHIPALDGVRGLAILMVMFFHFTVLWKDSKIDVAFGAATRFGWAGVDLFFVLSGFLITGILLGSKGQTNFFRNFYMRRVLRIFPLYYLVVFIGTVVLPHTPLTQIKDFRPINHGTWHFPFGYTSEMPHWPFYWLYFANFPIVFTSDFMNDLIAITWSLAIEEQFYMVWPFIVVACTTRTLKKVCLGVLSFSFLSRVAVAIYMHHYGDTANNHRMSYEFTFCRLDAISLGSLLATIMYEGGMDAVRALIPRTIWIAPIAAIVLLGSMAHAKKPIIHEDPYGMTVGYTSIAVLFLCIMIWTLTSAPRGIFNLFFTQKWLRFLGKYSYAIYLCHMPIHRIMREWVYRPEDFLMIGTPDHGTKLPGQIIFYVLCTVPTIGLALLSWNLIEKRFLRLKKYFPSHHPRELQGSAPAPELTNRV
ncbi:MAG TPA: acyltransferase [Tepidisphaeraceae bacterium]|nr:acyltransferase [Tepidisphaeraceae bacterium]